MKPALQQFNLKLHSLMVGPGDWPNSFRSST